MFPTTGARSIYASLLTSLGMIWPDVTMDTLHVPPDAVFLYYDIVLGSTLAYLGDRFFATDAGFAKLTQGRVMENLLDSVASLGTSEYARTVVTVFLDALVSVPIFVHVLRSYPHMSPFARRALKVGIALITFLVFNNMFRFAWAYGENGKHDGPVQQMIVVTFLVCATLAFLNQEPVRDPSVPGYAIMNPRMRYVFVGAAWLFTGGYLATRPGGLVEGRAKRLPGWVVLVALGTSCVGGLTYAAYTKRSSSSSSISWNTTQHATAATATLVAVVMGWVFVNRAVAFGTAKSSRLQTP